ncbi:MAG: bifunctional riboflavin kinase/FAD synthetase [Clostridia bacterium]|nr:bifunctional riboflavin kinase/FAD synthetase [Clostridia bacterium]
MKNTGGTAVAIGNFDGVHIGHQKILSRLCDLAKKQNLTSVVYTFKEHPLNLLKGAGTVKTILNNAEKEQLFLKSGADNVFFEDFNSVKDLEPEEFVKEILIDKFSAKLVVVGENNKFGKNSSGDANTLLKLGEKYGFSVCVVDSVYIDGKICSSSGVRQALENGNVAFTQKMLGRPYVVNGVVTGGKKLGRTYGFPTANLEIKKENQILKHGVYATVLTVHNNEYPSITNVGRTSFDKDDVERVETHIIGFDEDLYGMEISVEFIEFMRDTFFYENVSDLEKQLNIDREERIKIK